MVLRGEIVLSGGLSREVVEEGAFEMERMSGQVASTQFVRRIALGLYHTPRVVYFVRISMN